MKKDNLIFIHKLLKAIADSMIKVFIPLIILKNTNDIKLAMGYLIMYSSFVLLFMFVFKHFIQKFGVIAIVLHFVPVVATQYALSLAEINIVTVIACSALMALSQALYSIPLNLIFTFSDKKTNVGKFQIATNVGKLLTTIVAGSLLATIKESTLILSIVSSFIYICCVIPLFFAYSELIDNYNKVKQQPVLNTKINRWFIVFHISFGLFQPIMDNVVPLFLYVNNLSFSAVAYMIALVEFLKIVINYLSQFLVKRNKAIICVCISFVLFMISSFCIIFVKNSIALYVFSCTCSISFPLTFVPMFRLYCNSLRQNGNVFSGITRRDFDIFSCRPGLYALSFIGMGLYPCLVVGVAIVPIMFLSELKLLRTKENC